MRRSNRLKQFQRSPEINRLWSKCFPDSFNVRDRIRCGIDPRLTYFGAARLCFAKNMLFLRLTIPRAPYYAVVCRHTKRSTSQIEIPDIYVFQFFYCVAYGRRTAKYENDRIRLRLTRMLVAVLAPNAEKDE